jgi:hypothetical protein
LSSVRASISRTLLFPVALAACGTNKPELPAGLEAPASCVSPGYPAGPYGTEPGSLVRNACFQGFTAPDTGSLAESELESISLSDFHDPGI